MNLIVPVRPDISGYLPPQGPDIHPCAMLGPRWPADAHMLDWKRIDDFFTHDEARLRTAIELIRAAPRGARAVVLTGLHADTSGWKGDPPPVGSLDWYVGWDSALRMLSHMLNGFYTPTDTLIVGQSEDHPLSRWIDCAAKAAQPYQFVNYFALSDPESPHVYAPGHAAMPGLYATDHKTYPLDNVTKWLRGNPREIIPWITEPAPGDETAWKTGINICQLLGARRAVLFANHHGDMAANKAAIEREWTKVGNWTGGDITAPPRDQPGAP